MEWIEVADTAVKICGGALIAGISGLLVAHKNSSTERRKIAFVRRLDIIQSISTRAEKSFVSYREFLSLVDGSLVVKDKSKWESTIIEHLKDADKLVFSTRADLMEAIALLRLLGEAAIADSLVDVMDSFGNFRDPICVDKKMPTDDEVKIYASSFLGQIREFHLALSKVYRPADAG
ncbi:hypothetical protein FHY13_002942 [Xanthomonas arboricola]|uniref:hypothetical protein n=1 Tax=Xanthomonas euroxanthea TaxID=2259622 RepID=UPI00161A74E2|nr:hypothetical protein [Xanthomonas euroxanthea]MBB3814571.1 hypothetical protein [Xanthomonas euroxanthea]